MTPLERGQLAVMRIGASINALVLLIFAGGGAIALNTSLGVPPILVLGPVLLLLLYTVLIAPGRRYRAWGYAMNDEELRVAQGVWVRRETLVPLARAQHVDISQGPLERAFGVSRLILNTAGTSNSRVVLPGLARETAECIRDRVRARIREEDE